MSTVNLGLQSTGLMRKEKSTAAEIALKNCNSIKQLCTAGQQFKEDIAESMQQPVDLLSDFIHRLELNGKTFVVETACSEEELEAFWEVLLQTEPSLSLQMIQLESY